MMKKKVFIVEGQKESELINSCRPNITIWLGRSNFLFYYYFFFYKRKKREKKKKKKNELVWHLFLINMKRSSNFIGILTWTIGHLPLLIVLEISSIVNWEFVKSEGNF